MMRMTGARVLTTAVLTAGCALTVSGQQAAICGWVVTGRCPSCTPSTPGDSTCGCGSNAAGCDCVKQSGGVQNGIIVTCNTDAFTYNADPTGYRIGQGPKVWCSREKRCRHTNEDGGELNCAVPDPQTGSCAGGSQCTWMQTDQTERRTYVQGTRRCGGGPI